MVGALAVLMAGTGMLAAHPALGQAPGSVEGMVVDQAGGAPLAAAVVTLEETGASATTGPSSVINGQGAVAGTINAVTKQAEPTTVTEWRGLLSYGSFNTYRLPRRRCAVLLARLTQVNRKEDYN